MSPPSVHARREHDESVLAETYGTPLKAYTDFDKMLADPDVHIMIFVRHIPFMPNKPSLLLKRENISS